MQSNARLLAATSASVNALRRLADVAGSELAVVLLNIADLMDQARGDAATGELHQCDRLLAEHVESGIAMFAADEVLPAGTQFAADFLAAAALTALKDSARDLAWLYRAALEDAKRHVLADGWDGAMAPANRASTVRDAIAQRIAMIEPFVGAACRKEGHACH